MAKWQSTAVVVLALYTAVMLTVSVFWQRGVPATPGGGTRTLRQDPIPTQTVDQEDEEEEEEDDTAEATDTEEEKTDPPFPRSTQDPASLLSTSTSPLVPVYAFYFPQFHNDALNNKIWGENYTDWVALRAAPKLNRLKRTVLRPTDLGYYDLAQTDIRRVQGELARKYGIDGFIYHHYWFFEPGFPGPTMALPLLNMLRDGEPNVPFALNWAQDSWSRTWHGAAHNKARGVEKQGELLQKQYKPALTDPGVAAHFEFLLRFFDHPNYIKIDGKPLLFFHPVVPADWKGLVPAYQKMAVAAGYPGIHVVGLKFAANADMRTATDTKMAPPNLPSMALADTTVDYSLAKEMFVPLWCQRGGRRKGTGRSVAYAVMFDNTPRKAPKDAHIHVVEDPAGALGDTVEATLVYNGCCFTDGRPERHFMVVNAWNEWGEGMVLEPSNVYGYEMLEAVAAGKERAAEVVAKCRAAEEGRMLIPKVGSI